MSKRNIKVNAFWVLERQENVWGQETVNSMLCACRFLRLCSCDAAVLNIMLQNSMFDRQYWTPNSASVQRLCSHALLQERTHLHSPGGTCRSPWWVCHCLQFGVWWRTSLWRNYRLQQKMSFDTCQDALDVAPECWPPISPSVPPV